ncbi:reverse transcriptase [Senna tora]|uniref:Reverse transcriptase n=1 Tax=Senna tora TaxID=362788 RepID=A0A835C830_9FABA|nr:reverse transcriptase [Senna tora]
MAVCFQRSSVRDFSKVLGFVSSRISDADNDLLLQRVTALEAGLLKGVKLARYGLVLSHCFFADDALLFMRACKEECVLLKGIIADYCLASGQEVNFDKSYIYFSNNTPDDVKEERRVAKFIRRLGINLLGARRMVVSGLYFPEDGFMNARKGHRASWAWSSILEGLVNNKLSGGEVADCPDDVLVSELIVDKKWNLSSIDKWLSPLKVKAIEAIPLPRGEVGDKRLWGWAKDGKYSVKTGYSLAVERFASFVDMRPSSSFSTPKVVWNGIWKLNSTPKVKSFMWRDCGGALPTREDLFSRKCSSSPLCQICSLFPETIEHCLLLCGWVRKLWSSSPFNLKVSDFFVSRFDVWFGDLLSIEMRRSGVSLELVAFACWEVWKARYNFIFQGSRVCASSYCSLALREACEFAELAVNVDGSFLKDSFEAGVGFIARNSEGVVLAGYCGQVSATSGFMSEALAMKLALESFSNFPGLKVCFEIDCEELFRLVFGRMLKGGDWACGHILKEILVGAGSAQNVSFSLVRRTNNQAADWLARSAVKGLVLKDWVSSPPPPLALILSLDLETALGRMGVKKGVG